jgi:hypothetical protein
LAVLGGRVLVLWGVWRVLMCDKRAYFNHLLPVYAP